jgi:hypothetical protein
MQRHLLFLECDPDIPDASDPDIVISVEPYRGRYRLIEDGAPDREALTPQTALNALHVRLFELTLQDAPAAPLIHTACIRKDGRRILLIGSKGTGKTTLALQLMLSGFDIEADENVFALRSAIVARPRGLRIKQSALRYLPSLADYIATLPWVEDNYRQRIYNLDLKRMGRPWRIEAGPVDAVVLMRPNHGGSASLRPISPLHLVRELMMEVALPEVGRGAAIASIVSAVSAAKGFDLSLGYLPDALRCIERVLRETTG